MDVDFQFPIRRLELHVVAFRRHRPRVVGKPALDETRLYFDEFLDARQCSGDLSRGLAGRTRQFARSRANRRGEMVSPYPARDTSYDFAGDSFQCDHVAHYHPADFRRALRHDFSESRPTRPVGAFLHHVPLRQRLSLPAHGLRLRHGRFDVSLDFGLDVLVPQAFEKTRALHGTMTMIGKLTRRQTQRIGKAAVYVLLVLGALAYLFPLAWMISTSLKPIEKTMILPPQWIPNPVQWSNYTDALRYIDFLKYTANTLTVCVLMVIGTLLSSSLVAYGFSRIEWKGRDTFFFLTLATMMIPFPVLMIPLYAVFRNLHWIGTLKPLWVPFFFGSAFNIFLLRQFFMGIPKDLMDAARIDGCSELRIWATLVLPLARPALAVVALFQFIFGWNDFLGPLLFVTDQDQYTLALGLQFYQSQNGGTQWHLLMAASVLTTLPILVLFFFAQKTFIQGIALTGLKE